MKGFQKENSGAMIVEATFVFPIMFFIIVFLLYLGNMLYLRSQFDAVTEVYAVEGSSYYTDPMLEEVEKTKGIPNKFSKIHPYRYIFGQDDITGKIQTEVQKKLEKVGSGLLGRMEPKNINVQAKYENNIIYQKFSVEAGYKITMPIQFIWMDEPMTVEMKSKSVVSSSDGAEFVRNIDMGIDYYESSGAKEKVESLVGQAMGKVKSLFGKHSGTKK